MAQSPRASVVSKYTYMATDWNSATSGVGSCLSPPKVTVLKYPIPAVTLVLQEPWFCLTQYGTTFVIRYQG